MLQLLRRGIAGQLFALGIALSAVHFVTAYPDHCAGLQIFPSSGPLRFIWCYVLLAILVWEFRLQLPPTKLKWLLAGGCFCWLIGSLWSPESAAYSACIWLPAYVILVRQYVAASAAERTFRLRIRQYALWGLLPLALLGGAIATIYFCYINRLGHGPDWVCFVEYALLTRPDAFAWPVDPNGAVWALLLLFCGLSTAVAYSFRVQQTNSALMPDRTGLSLMIGAWTAVWATSSYFIPRSTDYTLINLSPIYVAAMAITLHVIKYRSQNNRWTFIIRSGFAPLLTLLLAAPFMDTAKLSQTVTSWQKGYDSEIERKLPTMDQPMREILKKAHVKSSDALVFVNANLLPAPPQTTDENKSNYYLLPHPWQPTMPFALLGPLREERQKLYMERFTQRTHLSGWLLQYKDDRSHWYPWFTDQVFKTHQPIKVFENDEYRIIWFELRHGHGHMHSLSAADISGRH
jgi:hypothetical protein